MKTPAREEAPVTTTEDEYRGGVAEVAAVVDDLVVDSADLPRVLDLFRDRCVVQGEVRWIAPSRFVAGPLQSSGPAAPFYLERASPYLLKRTWTTRR